MICFLLKKTKIKNIPLILEDSCSMEYSRVTSQPWGPREHPLPYLCFWSGFFLAVEKLLPSGDLRSHQGALPAKWPSVSFRECCLCRPQPTWQGQLGCSLADLEPAWILQCTSVKPTPLNGYCPCDVTSTGGRGLGTFG